MAPLPSGVGTAAVVALAAQNEGDFLRLIANPVDAYDEGLRFFRGQGLMNKTLKELAQDLDARGIPYTVIGAVALNQHGFRRFTEDIDIVLTREGLERFAQELVGRGYRPAFVGAKKKFRATAENVPIEVIVSGEYPGDGKPKPIVFPDPTIAAVEIDGIKTVPLETLIELKLASGMTGLGRRKDISDVQELIRVLQLPAEFADHLHASVQPLFRELQKEVAEAARQESAPHRDV